MANMAVASGVTAIGCETPRTNMLARVPSTDIVIACVGGSLMNETTLMTSFEIAIGCSAVL
jgi:hypothetical protein